MSADLIAELARLHHRATDLRAREAQLADAGENDPASDTWKTAAIVAASAEGEFEAALVEAWPALARLLREADQWRARESETQEALQAIGEEFGILGGEPRVDGIRRVLAEKEKALALAGATLIKLDQTNAELQARVLREAAEGWRPIETAPRTSKDVLLCRGSMPPIVAAWYDNGEEAGWSSYDKPDVWIIGEPTHWMPLPTPPARTEDSEETSHG